MSVNQQEKENHARMVVADIDVISVLGVVTLTGQVRNATICDTAREIAGQQEGVVAVTDEMEIMDHRTQKHR